MGEKQTQNIMVIL